MAYHHRLTILQMGEAQIRYRAGQASGQGSSQEAKVREKQSQNYEESRQSALIHFFLPGSKPAQGSWLHLPQDSQDAGV